MNASCGLPSSRVKVLSCPAPITLGAITELTEKISRDATMKIYDTMWEIFDRSKKLGAPTHKVADMLVEEKLARVSGSIPPLNASR